jgi:hypothetical protein
MVRTATIALLLSGVAAAQDPAALATARAVTVEGLKAYDDGRYAEAERKLGVAYGVVKLPTIGRARARALVELGRWVEAAELYLEVARLPVTSGDPSAQLRAQQEATAERSALVPRIPKLVVSIEGVEARAVTASVDGTSVHSSLLSEGFLVDPGTRRVSVVLGEQQQSREFVAREGQTETLRMRFGPAAAAPGAAQPTSSPDEASSASREPLAAAHADVSERGTHQRTVAWLGLGLGAAGVATGVVTASMALSKQAELEDEGCREGHCYNDQQRDVDAYQAFRSVSTAGFVIGGLGLVGGAVLLITSPRKRSVAGPGVVPWVSVGSAGVAGRF